MSLRMSAGLIGGLFVGVLVVGGTGARSKGVEPSAGEAKTNVVMPPTPLLPPRIADLQAEVISHSDKDTISGMLSDFQAFDATTCLPALPGGVAIPLHVMSTTAAPCTAVLKEDGIERLAVARYRRAGGGAVEVSALVFGDATGAYSAYTFYRSRMKHAQVPGVDARPGKGPGETTKDEDGTLVWAETSVLRVKGPASEEELSRLVAGLPKIGGRRALGPLLPTYAPTNGDGAQLETGSVRYALGPEGYQAMGGVLPAGGLSWEKSAEAMTADYSGRKGKGTLTLLLYPTPQIAGDRGRAIEKMVNDAGASKFGTVKMRRVGPLVGMTSGGLSAEQAQALMASLHLNEEVSFDQKMPLEFHAEVRKTASLLQNIAVLCGVLILAAILLGLFLGGARAGVRVLMGKPAASEPEFLTINLRDEPKALFANKDEASLKPEG